MKPAVQLCGHLGKLKGQLEDQLRQIGSQLGQLEGQLGQLGIQLHQLGDQLGGKLGPR